MSVHGRAEHLKDAVEDKLPLRAQANLPSILLKLPCVESTIGRKTQRDAGMVCQIFRRHRFGMLVEIGFGADHDEANVGPDPDRNHVLCDLFAETDPGIEAFGNDIGQSVIDDEFDFYIRISRQKLLQLRPDDCFDGVVAGGNPDQAGRLLSKLAQGFDFRLDFLETRPELLKKAFPGFGGGNAAGSPCQQANAPPVAGWCGSGPIVKPRPWLRPL